MAVRFDEVRIEVDYVADFVGHRTLRLVVPLSTDAQDDPLLLAILARKKALDAAILANASTAGDPLPLG